MLKNKFILPTFAAVMLWSSELILFLILAQCELFIEQLFLVIRITFFVQLRGGYRKGFFGMILKNDLDDFQLPKVYFLNTTSSYYAIRQITLN